jgi:hypothetical protein
VLFKGDLIRCRRLDLKEVDENIFKSVWGNEAIVLDWNPTNRRIRIFMTGIGYITMNEEDVELIARSNISKEIARFCGKLKDFPYQIYCDMDDVLVDFVNPANTRINEALENPPERLRALCKRVSDDCGKVIDLRDYKREKRAESLSELVQKLFETDLEFWKTLPFNREGAKLWRVIATFEKQPMLLTSPMDKGGSFTSHIGKKYWVKTNLNALDTYEWDERMFFEHKKYEYAMQDEKPNVLIDDFVMKVEPFTAHGGIGILHTDAQTTLTKLEEIYDAYYSQNPKTPTED